MSAELSRLLSAIAHAEALVRHYDDACTDVEAQRADEAAETARRAARKMVESAFPGVSWADLKALV